MPDTRCLQPSLLVGLTGSVQSVLPGVPVESPPKERPARDAEAPPLIDGGSKVIVVVLSRGQGRRSGPVAVVLIGRREPDEAISKGSPMGQCPLIATPVAAS